MNICGTGHRPKKLGGYSDRAHRRLIDLAAAALERYDPDMVISGMALGWDQALAAACIKLRIPFTAAVPFPNQEFFWTEESKAYYWDLMGHAYSVQIVSKGPYSPRLMQVRNEWMVDHADMVLALWSGSSGGTRNCLSYATARNVPYVNLYHSWMKYK